jgi:peptide/nickel transport system permease protein
VSASTDLLLEPADIVVSPTGGEDIAAKSPLQLFWRRFRKDKVAMGALFFIGVLLFVAIFHKQIVNLLGLPGPNDQSTDRLGDFGDPTGPSSHNPFGVDKLGRDVLARVIYGAWVSIRVAFISTAIAVFVGVVIGLLSGYYRGWVDTGLSRVMDVMLAFPVLVLALGLGAACTLGNGCLGGLIKPGLNVVIVVIALTTWPYMARIVRGQVFSLREKEFIEASRSLGARDGRILFREILPNLVAPIIVYGTVLIPQNILYEAALSFLGVGIQPPDASWGQMISDATDIFDTAWWYMAFPGIALLLTVLAFNLVGDGLQDALNPRTAK